MNGLMQLIDEYQHEYAPKEYFDYQEFDDLFSPLINNPQPLFDFLKEGHNISVLETIIALVIFS